MKKYFASALLLAVSTFGFGQAISTNGGSIQGTITDPSGANIPGATITITDSDTGFKRTLTSDSAGFYSIGPLNPGAYVIDVTSGGFEHLKVTTVVRTGTVTSGSEKLTVGKQGETVEVNAGALQINTDQIGVSGVVTREQIDSLPINGRNILDIAQLQPGVILQSGESFDPTKAGYSAISVGGVSSRSTRILLDGQDITDENVGTTLFNVPTGAVDEFQLNRSTQDVSGEVTSTGQVLISTRSGTNAFHGNVFYNFQDHSEGFAQVAGHDQPFQRNQFGGYIGGPIIKDKLFFFGGAERILQHESDVAQTNPLFNDITTEYPLVPTPFTDNFSMARLDYNAPHGIHLFARAAYAVNSDVSTFGFGPYSIYQNRDNVPSLVGGADFTTGRFTHSIRGGYEKFHNLLDDATSAAGNSIYNPFPIGGPNGAITLYDGADGFYAGPNYLAPQGTFQSDKQLRYDGTWTKGAHSIKFGGEVNRILGGSFAPFFGIASFEVFGAGYGSQLAVCGTPGATAACPGDPVNGYGAVQINVGNGNGFFSERPAFGLAGGATPSYRFAGYAADTWKASSAITLTAGLRWSVDTDRANQDLPTPLCSSVDPSLQFTGCTGNTPLFDQYQSGLGYRTHQPYGDFGPQLGFVVSPGAHKFSIRGGAGIYYENDIFNNTGNTRTESIQKAGQFQNTAQPCSNFYPGTTLDNTTNFPGINIANLCGGASIAAGAPDLSTIRSTYQGITKGVSSANPDYIGSASGDNLKALNIYAGPYKTPYSIQLNGGVQEQLSRGLIFSADFIHNATLKIPLTIDVNHQGAARNLNVAAATSAISNTTAAFGCAGGDSTAAIDCAISNGATIQLFGFAGLTSANDGYGYSGAPGNQPGGLGFVLGVPNGLPAFGGDNNNVGVGDFVLPIGKSGYDALQLVLQQQKSNPLPGITTSNLQISYSLSRVVSASSGNSDQFFAGQHALSNDNPNEFIGRNALDHTNELSFGGSFGIKYGLQIGATGHFFSAPPSSLGLDASQYSGTGEIFRTDVDGDGTVGDLLPGTQVGSYMHQVKGNLSKVIGNYNATHAGQPTPAGQALISNGLINLAELQALGAVQPTIAQVSSKPTYNPAFRTFDLSVSYPINYLNRFHQGLSIVPGVAMYNVTNMSNYGNYNSTLLNTADGGGTTNTLPGYITGPNNQGDYNNYHIERGSGTFDAGGPRTTEFQLKVNF